MKRFVFGMPNTRSMASVAMVISIVGYDKLTFEGDEIDNKLELKTSLLGAKQQWIDVNV